MSIEVEYWFEKNCLLRGEIVDRDDSFSHEFGFEKSKSIELKGDLEVIVYVGNFDFDQTKFFREEYPKYYALMEESFLDHAREKHSDDFFGGDAT